MSNSEKLIEFWTRKLEEVFPNRLTTRNVVIRGGNGVERPVFTIDRAMRPELDVLEIVGQYRLGARQMVNMFDLESRNMDAMGIVTDSAERMVRRALAGRLMQDAVDLLREGSERSGHIMDREILVTTNMPQNIGAVVHPLIHSMLLSTPQFLNMRRS